MAAQGQRIELSDLWTLESKVDAEQHTIIKTILIENALLQN